MISRRSRTLTCLALLGFLSRKIAGEDSEGGRGLGERARTRKAGEGSESGRVVM
jgi:hypothetical protein